MARKQGFFVTCDICRKTAEVENLNYLPETWYHIALPDQNGKLQPTSNGFDFCSLKCIHSWASNRSKVKGEVIPSTRYDKKKCEFCEMMIAPQGLRTHVQTVHSEIWEDWALEKGYNPNSPSPAEMKKK